MSKNSENICLVLFGETGHGKSTLGNAILGKKIFKTNDTIQSVTKEIFGSYGINDSENIFVIDTPGINDSEGRDNIYLKDIATYLKKRNDIKGIVIVLNYGLNTKNQKSVEKCFKIVFRLFKSVKICFHILIAFTHFFGSRKNVPKRNEQGKLKSNIFIIFKETFFDMFGEKTPINSLPFFFLDIDPEDEMDSDSQMEIANMITTIHSKNQINPSIIQIKDDYNVKEELSSSRIIEDIVGYEGDFIIKKTKTIKKTILKFYDSTLNDSILEDIVDEKIEKILNVNLVEEKKKLEMKKNYEEEMKKKIQKEIEEQEKLVKQKEEEMRQLKEQQKRIEEKKRQLEKERIRIQKEREKREKEEEQKRLKQKGLEKERELEKQRQKRREELEKKRKRISICNQIKSFIENPYYENDSSYVNKLNETWNYGMLKTPDYCDKEIKIELLKTEKVDLSVQAWTTRVGKISGALSGKIILGWKLINRHKNENGGTWKRNIKVLGTSNYDFTFTSGFWRACHWTLELYGIEIPNDYYENKDLKASDYYY